MIDIILFTTAGCHLCEQAAELLASLNNNYTLNIISTEIGDDDVLVEQYGIRIPVLKFENGNELNWPFTRDEIIQLIDN